MHAATILRKMIDHARDHRRNFIVVYQTANALLLDVELLVVQYRGLGVLLHDRILAREDAHEGHAQGEHVGRET